MTTGKPKQAIPLTEACFKEVGDHCGTDKTLHHGYHRFYPSHISHLRRFRKFAIVEIGYGSGNSIPLWLSIFPETKVICLDKDHQEEGPGYRVLKTDQSSTDSLQRSLGNVDLPIRLVIDDGSHKPSHQILTFSTVFPSLCEDGIYVIEDIETSYWTNGAIYGYETRYGLFNQWSAIEAFKLASDYTNRFCLAACDLSLLEYRMAIVGLTPEAAAMISSITFAQNCIIIRKGKKTDSQFTDAPYLHQANTDRDP